MRSEDSMSLSVIISKPPRNPTNLIAITENIWDNPIREKDSIYIAS